MHAVDKTPESTPQATSARPTLERQETFNSVTHALGVACSVVGAVILLRYSFATGDAWRVLGCVIFAMTLIGVYTASTLSHCVVEPAWRLFFRKLDQALIYLLIAGSYTPFALVYLRFAWWWWAFLALMWSLALFGFISKMFFRGQSELVLLRRYLVLGWLPIMPAFKYVEHVPLGALFWVLIGGLYYSAGAIFFYLDYKRYYFHAIWHTFVIAGSTCHFFGVLIFVAYPLQV